MERANQVGILLSMLVGIVWGLIALLDGPTVLGIVLSMLLGVYWAVGRDMIFGRQDREKI